MRALATAAIVVAQRVRWRVLVLALALLAIMVTVAPEQAAAQTDTTFISNTGQTSTTTDTIVRATSFGTGAATYTLSSVGIYLGSIPASNITPVVRIHENGMTGSFIRPGAVVATLTNPGTFQAGAVNSFNAPASTTLSASTTYWVVTTNSAATNGTGFQVSTINSSNLDSGTAAGWTLGASRFKTNITLSFWTNSNVRIRFAIRGAVANTAPTASDSTVTTNEDTDYTFTAANFVITVEVTAQDGQATETYTVTVTRPAGLSSDATLSSLTLSGIDFGTFDPTTTSYRARVASETTGTTVTPTVTQSAASYVIKLGGVTDADGVVSLSEVSNVIAIDVTAEDGETSQTYTVTVARGPSPCVTGGAVSDSTNTGLVSDCDALLAVKDTLAGTASLNWSADTSMASWEGLTLLGTPERVAGLSLSNKSLDGEIPAELGDLSMLAKLDLRSNQLSGSVPGSLVRLSKLTRLNLRSNQLSGSIPGSLGRLIRLTVLNLHSNDLSGDIPDLSTTMLQELYLANNYDEMVEGSGLTGPVPAWLNGMTNMRELWLWGNRLSGTIPDLSGMTSLQKLKLSANNLTGGIPASLGSMSNLKWLIINSNPLGGAIPDLSGMTSLTHLWLHSNELTGSIPSGDKLPPNVDDLNLRDNMLTGRIPDLSGLDMATRVRLHNNMLSGEVPATLGDLDRLRQLWLYGNRLTGIAAELGDLSDTLIEIALRRNSWTDDACVPAALANVATNDYQEAGLEACGNDGGS